MLPGCYAACLRGWAINHPEIAASGSGQVSTCNRRTGCMLYALNTALIASANGRRWAATGTGYIEQGWSDGGQQICLGWPRAQIQPLQASHVPGASSCLSIQLAC